MGSIPTRPIKEKDKMITVKTFHNGTGIVVVQTSGPTGEVADFTAHISGHATRLGGGYLINEVGAALVGEHSMNVIEMYRLPQDHESDFIDAISFARP